jgi:lipid A 4'-phosphatase
MAGFDWQRLVWRQRSGPAWSAEARLLGVYLLSNPATNRIGCFPFSIGEAARQTGLSGDEIAKILAQFEQDEFARFDGACGWIWIREALLHQPFIDSEEVRRALPELSAVPRHASFHDELIPAFRASADRPLNLARQWTDAGEKLRSRLPGLPLPEPKHLQPIAKIMINMLDYINLWKNFLIDIINVRRLRILGILTIVGAILFIVFPGIDLGVAGFFYEPPRNFFLGASWIGRFFDGDVHYAMEYFLILLVFLFLYGLYRGRPVWRLTPKRFLFVALSIALGAGLLTNVIFKDSWGRARPSQIIEFGGNKQFSPPFMRSSQCDKNCSFVSGDASLAASFMAFAVIADRNRRKWWMGLGGFTALVGLMRMARGSHFLSDVTFAVIFTLMVVFTLERLIIEDQWRNWPRWRTPPI